MSYGTLELEDGTKLKDHHNIIRKKLVCRVGNYGKGKLNDKELIKRQLEGKE